MAASISSKSDEILLQKIEMMIDELPNQSAGSCIYRVPKLLRGLNPEAYTPMAVSIGPIHHKDHGQDSSQVDDLDFFVNRLYKLRYLRSFLCQSSQCGLEAYLEIVKSRMTVIRNCYAYSDKIFNYDDNIFMEMVFFDCAFIIQLFRKCSKLYWHLNMDSIFMPLRIVKEIASDLVLAENQLPLFILNKLHDLSVVKGRVSENHVRVSFIDIACEFLKIDKSKLKDSDPLHLLDMVRISLLPPLEDKHDDDTFSPRTKRKRNVDLPEIVCPTATILFEAGIIFEVKEDAFSFIDIRFDVKKGILYIPKLRVDDRTQRQLRNLIAFELSYPRVDTYITDYQFFLDCLINTPTVVQLLTEAGIIENRLGSEKNLSDLINSMGKHAYHFTGGYLYSHIGRQLNIYQKKKWNRYKAILKQVYFSHPWEIIDLCYAGFLLLLTIIQVVAGILALPALNKLSNN